MPYTGHCNCESVHITLPQQPENSMLCHCDNCRRVGGAFSVNYLVPEDDMTLDDPKTVMKTYNDKKTASGNVVQRCFCSNCGCSILTKTPQAPGKVYLKATLFDTVSPSGGEIFTEKRLKL